MNNLVSRWTAVPGMLLVLASFDHAEIQAQLSNTQAVPSIQSIEPSLSESVSGQGTESIGFVPEQSAGVIQACTMVFRAWDVDHLYRNDTLFFIEGNISYRTNEDRSGHVMNLKIRVIDSDDSGPTKSPPFFAFIQTKHGTTAKSMYRQFDSPDTFKDGFRHFSYYIDDYSKNVLTDIPLWGSAIIGFNRFKNGPDLLVRLDLSVASSTFSETGVIERRSNQMRIQFSKCIADVLKQLMEATGPSKPRSN